MQGEFSFIAEADHPRLFDPERIGWVAIRTFTFHSEAQIKLMGKDPDVISVKLPENGS